MTTCQDQIAIAKYIYRDAYSKYGIRKATNPQKEG